MLTTHKLLLAASSHAGRGCISFAFLIAKDMDSSLWKKGKNKLFPLGLALSSVRRKSNLLALLCGLFVQGYYSTNCIAGSSDI